MPDNQTTVKDGDTVEWTGAGVPVGMYADRGLVFYTGEPYVVGEPTYEGGSPLGAEFANALVEGGHLRKTQPVAAIPDPVPPTLETPVALDTPKRGTKGLSVADTEIHAS